MEASREMKARAQGIQFQKFLELLALYEHIENVGNARRDRDEFLRETCRQHAAELANTTTTSSGTPATTTSAVQWRAFFIGVDTYDGQIKLWTLKNARTMVVQYSIDSHLIAPGEMGWIVKNFSDPDLVEHHIYDIAQNLCQRGWTPVRMKLNDNLHQGVVKDLFEPSSAFVERQARMAARDAEYMNKLQTTDLEDEFDAPPPPPSQKKKKEEDTVAATTAPAPAPAAPAPAPMTLTTTERLLPSPDLTPASQPLDDEYLW